MRLIAFFISTFIYSLILFFLYSILVVKKQKKTEVLIHTAIIPKQVDKKKAIIKKQPVRKQINKSKIKKKLKSKPLVTKGGKNIKFDDIFKNVNYNIKTQKIKQKASLDMSRLKGIEKTLNKVKNIRINISVKSNTKEKVNINRITKKLGEVWDKVSLNPGEYAIIRVVNENGVRAFILETNLDSATNARLISQIENLVFDKKFDITVKFQTKGSK